jgi:hypothetical protein
MLPPQASDSWQGVISVLGLVGSLASLIGIFLALVSIRQARDAARRSASEAELSKDASLRAELEVLRFRDDLKLLTSIVDFEHALGLMDDIKSFMRHSTYRPVPDRIATLISCLNRIRASSSVLDDDWKPKIQQCIRTLRRIEDAIDKANLDSVPPKDAPHFNRRISEQIDQLHPLLIDLKDKMGAR